MGYKKSDAAFEFTDHIIQGKEGIHLYLATDGYLDQNGGEKGFPMGKKRFGKIIEENINKPFAEQKGILLKELAAYQGQEERNDDITVVGIKV